MNVQALKLELLRDEGFIPDAYQDHLGYWTIGIGRLIDGRKGGGITREEAEYLLENDIGRTLLQLRSKIKFFNDLSDARQRALVNMAFNLGVAGLLKFRRMLAALEAGHYKRASEEALNSRWARQVGARAQRIANMIENG